LRSLSKSLDKDWLEQFDFIQNLKTQINRINAGNEINASLNGDEALDLPSAERIILFRIVQEAIQNAVKHGNCKNISISIKKSIEEAIEIVVRDDGKGFNADSIGKGMGLSNMQRRASILNGFTSYESAEGKGTTVLITIPQNNLS